MESLNNDKPAPDSITRIVKVVVALIVVGVALWLVNTYIPMAASIRAILNIVVVVATCVLVLQAVGLWSAIVRLWTDPKPPESPAHSVNRPSSVPQSRSCPRGTPANVDTICMQSLLRTSTSASPNLPVVNVDRHSQAG